MIVLKYDALIETDLTSFQYKLFDTEYEMLCFNVFAFEISYCNAHSPYLLLSRKNKK